MYKEIDDHLTVTISTRFDRETAEVLRTAARERGIGVTTLIRMWTLDRLRRLNRNHKPGMESPPPTREKAAKGAVRR
jgi:hypothetical protein